MRPVGYTESDETKKVDYATISSYDQPAKFEAIQIIELADVKIENGFKISYPSLGSIEESKGHVARVFKPPVVSQLFIS